MSVSPRLSDDTSDDTLAHSELHTLFCKYFIAEGVNEDVIEALRAAFEEAHAPPWTEMHQNLLTALRSHQHRSAVDVPPTVHEHDLASPVQSEMDRMPTTSGRLVSRQCILSLFIVVMLSLIFAPCLTYSEWYIDELFAAVRNVDARGETPIWELFRHDFWGSSLNSNHTHKSYRPLVVLSFALQYVFNNGSVKPQPLRAFNVALHVTNSILVLRLLRHQGSGWKWAALAASLFAVHPVHAENVIYLVGRADALATHCWLWALLIWPMSETAHKRRSWFSGCLRLFLLVSLTIVGGLCKEAGFCVILQVVTHELLTKRPFRAVPLTIAFGLVFMARSWITGGTSAGFSYVDTPVRYHDNRTVRLFTYLYHHGKYAQLLVLPWVQAWEYSYDALPLLHKTWQDVRVLVATTAYLAVAALASWAFTVRNRNALLGLSNVIIPFIPASNLFFVVGVTVGERLLYPCNVGAAMLVAAIGAHIECPSGIVLGRESHTRRRWPFISGLALLLVYMYLCCLRVHQWSSTALLFEADVVSYPRSAKMRHQLGTVMHQEGRFDEALHHFETALSIFGDSALTEYCLAQVLVETGRAREALPHFEHILKGHMMGFARFNLFGLYVDYGFTLMMLREFEASLTPLRQGLSLNEDVPHGLNALGFSLAHLNRMEEARDAFQRGVEYDPNNAYLLNNFGVTLTLTGRIEQGMQAFRLALSGDPNAASILQNIHFAEAMSTGGKPKGQLILELFFNRAS